MFFLLDNLNVLRQCQYRTPGNESCEMFYRQFEKDTEKSFHNVSCYTCDTDGCNNSGTIHILMSLLFSCTILSVLI